MAASCGFLLQSQRTALLKRREHAAYYPPQDVALNHEQQKKSNQLAAHSQLLLLAAGGSVTQISRYAPCRTAETSIEVVYSKSSPQTFPSHETVPRLKLPVYVHAFPQVTLLYCNLKCTTLKPCHFGLLEESKSRSSKVVYFPSSPIQLQRWCGNTGGGHKPDLWLLSASSCSSIISRAFILYSPSVCSSNSTKLVLS